MKTIIYRMLKATPEVQDIAGDRVYDRDIRRAGWDRAVGAIDANGDLLPVIMVADGGDLPFPFHPTPLLTATVNVATFASTTTAGRKALDALKDVVIYTLDHWRDPETGAYVTYGGSAGEVEDDGAVWDTLRFDVAHVRRTARW